MYDKYIPVIRLENLFALAACLAIYQHLRYSWEAFAYAFLLPDIALFAYVAGSRVGARAYNTTHSYIGPALLVLLAPWVDGNHAFAAALIWTAHVAMDRSLGFGLKSTTSFRDTHLGMVNFNRMR
ncbi:DUF4260 domain-containing protein [Acidiferrobacter thiooxydans]|jgi:hypothetical protein|nr:DUF4260 domain-containing protein [Acidiferrobacter thiooxydans]MDA8120391.1 DUF4260 domain-containing protein [Gammaproteobacteria bacterium]MDA8190556.1 DUF4260 domain-containing protein [Gammaproteobacteria bacterium]UEN98522.1 DUF4260 domain-containing protein [Acidiferrobacter thiooxydans]